jgi:hypothetical protein
LGRSRRLSAASWQWHLPVSASRRRKDTYGPGPPNHPVAVAAPSGRGANPPRFGPSPDQECAEVGGCRRAGEHSLLGHHQQGSNPQDNGRGSGIARCPACRSRVWPYIFHEIFAIYKGHVICQFVNHAPMLRHSAANSLPNWFWSLKFPCRRARRIAFKTLIPRRLSP